MEEPDSYRCSGTWINSVGIGFLEPKKITVYYKCDNGEQNYIDAMYVTVRTDADSEALALSVAIVTMVIAHKLLAMSSPAFALIWFTPGTSGGGGQIASTNYAVNFTVGQSIAGATTAGQFAAHLGYWFMEENYGAFLPLAAR